MERHRAWHCHQFGDPASVTLETVPTPAAGPGEILIDVHACAVAFHEMLMVQGLYQLKPALPFVPGSEASGVVRATGAGVTRFRVGERVIGAVRHGAHSERLCLPESNCFALPAAFDFAAGAAFLTAYRTAWVALVPRGRLQAGEVLLVHGASGGVGLAAVELGKVLGATVIATASTREKLQIAASHGADHLICTADGRIRDTVRALTHGRGADVIYDPVGGDLFDESTHCIAPFGRLLVIGFASGRIPSLPVNLALIKQFSVVGVRAGEYGRLDPAAGRAADEALFALAEAGRLHPRIHARWGFGELPRAFAALAARAVSGRVVLETAPR